MAQSSGIALTDLSIGTEATASGDGAISYDNSTGIFTYTPPTLAGIGGTTDNVSEGSTNLYYTDARVDTHLNTSVATTNQVLSWSGTDYAWVDQSSGGGSLWTATGNDIYYTTGKVGVGTATPGYDLDVHGTANVGALSVTNILGNEVAIGTGAGQTSQKPYSVAIGIYAGQSNQGSYSVAMGVYAGQSNQGSNAIAMGNSAGRSYQNKFTIAIGHSAGSNNQASYAVAMGALAGQSNQSSNAIAVGYEAGRDSQGTYGIAVGLRTAQTSQGDNAIAVGYQAGQSFQKTGATAIGTSAGSDNQASYAVAMGYLAGATSQGYTALAIGTSAGLLNQKAAAVAVGRDAGTSNQGSYAIAVGEKAGYSSQHNNSIVLNATGVALNTAQASSFYVKPVRGGNFAASALAYTDTGEVVEETNMHFTTSGYVGIGVVSPTYELQVSGNIYASYDVTAFSDMRFKENIKRIENPLDSICVLNGYTYNKKGGDKRSMGVIAQEILEVFPEVVHGSEEEGYSVAYGNMAGAFIEAIKELKDKILSLENEIKELKK